MMQSRYDNDPEFQKFETPEGDDPRGRIADSRQEMMLRQAEFQNSQERAQIREQATARKRHYDRENETFDQFEAREAQEELEQERREKAEAQRARRASKKTQQSEEFGDENGEDFIDEEALTEMLAGRKIRTRSGFVLDAKEIPGNLEKRSESFRRMAEAKKHEEDLAKQRQEMLQWAQQVQFGQPVNPAAAGVRTVTGPAASEFTDERQEVLYANLRKAQDDADPIGVHHATRELNAFVEGRAAERARGAVSGEIEQLKKALFESENRQRQAGIQQAWTQTQMDYRSRNKDLADNPIALAYANQKIRENQQRLGDTPDAVALAWEETREEFQKQFGGRRSTRDDEEFLQERSRRGERYAQHQARSAPAPRTPEARRQVETDMFGNPVDRGIQRSNRDAVVRQMMGQRGTKR